MSPIIYTNSHSEKDLRQILALQQLNLPKNISKAEAREQGFVTVEHNFELLSAMNEAYPHVIAKSGDEVVGYALVMVQEFKNQIPVLIPMFDMFDQLVYNGKAMNKYKYFVMGQVCIAKGFRGQGLFAGMYRKMGEQLRSHFDFVLTEIATRNLPSMRAHAKVGFEVIKIYEAKEEEWAIVLWDFE